MKKLPLAKLVSLFENQSPDAAQQRHDIIKHILSHPNDYSGKGVVVGFTGTPGAGKSSLVAELCKILIRNNPSMRIAVLAIDPSSQVSGGSILGDRTRMHSGEKNPNLFFRSQASNLELGGVTHNTFQATRLLRHLFDLVIIETVGIGQNEIDIQYMSDHTFLVMQPLAGDQIQFMKCGIMEIPDSFIVNKCDEENLARTSYHMLRSSLKQAKLVMLDEQDDFQRAAKDKIFLTSAVKNKGIDELSAFIASVGQSSEFKKTDYYYLFKSIQHQFGRFGTGLLEDALPALFDGLITYEEKEVAALQLIKQGIR